MSRNVSKAGHFFKLLLDQSTTKLQGIGLIYSANPTQVTAITEIIHNLILGNIPLSKNVKVAINKHKTILHTLGNSTVSYKKKVRIIKDNFKFLYSLLIKLRVEILNQIE